jgi:hypothetical protein
MPQPLVCVPVLATGVEEKGYFEWFKCRTATKLPGSFISGFWNRLIFQASLNEPAVLHAVLALSCVHKRGSLHDANQRNSDDTPDKQEQFILQHYVKAISYLQPHFSIKDMSSFRVALITCAVFIYLEFLRGHFETAQRHLENGLKVLTEAQMPSLDNDGILILKPCRESIDDWIIEAFSRLNIQVELFKQTYQHPCLVIQVTRPELPTAIFRTFNEAWQPMEYLLNQIFHLTKLVRKQGVSESASARHPSALLRYQQHIRIELARWLDLYAASKKELQGQNSTDKVRAYKLLCVYNTMANIMAATCLSLNDELIFDAHTDQFVSLIRQLANLWTSSSISTIVPAQPGHPMNMSRSIVDMGWIQPLYFVAVKCRIHRIRIQAIKLLETSSHREGIWDAKTAACVARKVMEIEESNFYEDVDGADDFPLSSCPRPQDLLQLTLPDANRIREAELVLSGEPMDKVLLFCKQKQDGTYRKVCIGKYDVLLQRWIDEGEDK